MESGRGLRTGGVLGAMALGLCIAGSAIAQSTGETVQYGYDAQGRLSTVTYADGTSQTYLYEDTNHPNALTGVIDENGARFSSWSYDAQGRAISTSEAGGAGAHSLVYNTDGSVTVTDALGAVRIFTFGRYGDRNLVTGISGSQCPTCVEPKATTYDLQGFLSSRTDYNGNVTTYTYDDSRGLEISRTEGSGTAQARTITTQWHATYRLPTLITEPNRTSSFTYDASGNLLTKTVTDTSVTPNTSRTWTYTYDTYGRVLTADGPRTDVSDVTTYTYYTCTTGYECGEVHTITDAAGHVTTYNTYNVAGLPLTITDANSVVTTLTYDARQRLKSRTVGSEVTSFDYWPTGLLKKVTLPDGSFLSYVYDNAHRLTEIDDAAGNRVVYTLDAGGNHTAENVYDPSNALSRTRSQVFNSLSQLWKDVKAAGTSDVTTTFGYDTNGNQTTMAEPLARNTSNAYDALNRLTQVTDPATGVTKYGYDANDNLTSVTDPRNLQTSYAYNGHGDLKQLISPDTGTTTNTYDETGNLKTSTDARAKTATYSYDALNRVTQVTYPDQTIGFTYDVGANAAGRLSSMSDGSGATSWGYTSLGRVSSKTQTIGSVSKSVSYGYNAAGQLTSITTPTGQVIGYGYTNNQVTSITVNGTPLLSQVLYEPFGPTRGWTWGNNTLTDREYDQDGQLTSNDSVGSAALTYNVDGTVHTVTQEAPASLGPSGSTTLTTATTSNQLTSTTGQLARTYSYDAAGHTLSDGTRTFTYDAAGRLITASGSAGSGTYAYNALGQRVRKTANGATMYFVYDETGHLLGEYDQSGNLLQEIVWLNDIPVGSIRTNTSGIGTGVFYVHTNHLNAPTKLTEPTTNAIVWRWDFDPYGNGIANEDPDGNGAAVHFNLRFPGQYFDQETGLSYNYFRDYDPTTGRYVASDPIGLRGGLNTYAYVENNPVSYTDIGGLSRFDFDGPGDTSFCSYYDQKAKENPNCSYYRQAANICRGKNGGVNALAATALFFKYFNLTLTDSESVVLTRIRKELIEQDQAARGAGKIDGCGCTQGDDIDDYHNDVFKKELFRPFYGGNLVPQGSPLNPVPYDPRRTQPLDDIYHRLFH